MRWPRTIIIKLNYITNEFHHTRLHTSGNNPSSLKRTSSVIRKDFGQKKTIAIKHCSTYLCAFALTSST